MTDVERSEFIGCESLRVTVEIAKDLNVVVRDESVQSITLSNKGNRAATNNTRCT
jgi:hypothetical protein